MAGQERVCPGPSVWCSGTLWCPGSREHSGGWGGLVCRAVGRLIPKPRWSGLGPEWPCKDRPLPTANRRASMVENWGWWSDGWGPHLMPLPSQACLQSRVCRPCRRSWPGNATTSVRQPVPGNSGELTHPIGPHPAGSWKEAHVPPLCTPLAARTLGWTMRRRCFSSPLCSGRSLLPLTLWCPVTLMVSSQPQSPHLHGGTWTYRGEGLV